jgi:hypothetical protein
MTHLTFNETTYEFRTHYGENHNSIHIFVNGELKKVREQDSCEPDCIEEALELIRYYDL